jgi:hypothetical protein
MRSETMVFSPVNPWTFPSNPNFPWLPPANTITAITRANPAVVTTGTAHGYQTGFNIRIVLPFPYALSFGMYQINEEVGTIVVLSPTSFSISIDTTGYAAFTVGTTLQSAQTIPISQYVNGELLDFTQVNPFNPNTLVNVRLFQGPGLQAPGPCSTSQT